MTDTPTDKPAAIPAPKDVPIADDCQTQFAPGHNANECDHCKAAAKTAAKG